VLGIFRSLGSLSRAFTPMLAGLVYWSGGGSGGTIVFVIAALLAGVALVLSRGLPEPAR
jgi:hypothetical protein